tara:strand:+ start:7058 stop:7597 length:540 start_codon:yes stop_codon:yes gene_type:complete
MTIEKNFFVLFGLPQTYQIDMAELSGRYLSLQKNLHPDRHAHLGEREQLRAIQAVAHLNDALATLKSPLKRAAYLLRLKGIDTAGSSTTISDGAFLMQQMLLREELDEAKDAEDPLAELERLQKKTALLEAQLHQSLASLLDSDDAAVLQQALATLRKLQFFDKLQQQIELSEDQLADF